MRGKTAFSRPSLVSGTQLSTRPRIGETVSIGGPESHPAPTAKNETNHSQLYPASLIALAARPASAALL